MPTPKLRFKEFDGDWSETLFQDLFIFKNGVNASKEQYGSGIKFINVLDIINNPNGITYDSIIGSVNISSKEIDKNLVKYGDVLFQRSSETREEVGQSNVYLGKDPVVFGGFVIRGSAQKEYNPIFMNGLLKTDYLRDQITQLSGGSTRFNIGQDSLNKVSAYLPSKAEQTKIASFLSNVDEKISQLTQKHELLSQYKQGMMQKLFSQKIRFKADDGGEFGEWEEKNILKIADVSIGLVTTMTTNYREKGTPLIRNSDIKPNNILKNKLIFLDSDFADSYENRKLKVNDIVTVHTGDVGVSSLIPEELNGAIGFATINTRVIDENVSPCYLVWYFNSKKFINWCVNYSTGDGRQNLNLKDFNTAVIPLPSLEEQTKIANLLSAIDQKVEVVAQQIEQAKHWKKGLLQQMFV